MRISYVTGLAAMLMTTVNFAQTPQPEKLEEIPPTVAYVGNESAYPGLSWLKPGLNYGRPEVWTKSIDAFPIIHVAKRQMPTPGKEASEMELLELAYGKIGKFQNYLLLDKESGKTQKLFQKEMDEILFFGRIENGLARSHTISSYTAGISGSSANNLFFPNENPEGKNQTHFIGLTRENARDRIAQKLGLDNLTLWIWTADGKRVEKLETGIEQLTGLTDPVDNKLTALVRKEGRDIALTIDASTMKLLQRHILPALPKEK
jgi:hypothetical protein